ncbi:MAG: SurA N-terminal domain-containing protein [Caulobacter sp.]|nr:SurA N-terminal domain-containing protein [Caulobacter sp.]
MLAAFRSFAKSPWSFGLLGLIIAAFVLVGTTDIFGSRAGINVITAGSRTVTQPEFQAAFRRSLQQLGQQYGQPVSQEMALEQGLDQRILSEMTRSEALAELLRRLGVRAPQDAMREQLREIPAFFDPLTGEFSESNYLEALRREGLTRDMFEKDMRDGLMRAQFVPAAADGLRAPLAYSALGGVIALEQRDLAYFVVTPQSVGKIAEPTEAEIQAFMKENAAQLTLPEFRGMTVVRLSRKAMETSVTVDPAEVQKRFDFEKDSLSRAELRTVVQIPVKDNGQATTVLARINKGEDARVVAGELGIKPIFFTDKPRSAFFDAGIRDEAFRLPLGGANIVKGGFGLAVIKIEKVVPGSAATLEGNRTAIEAKVRADAADRKVSEASKVYEDARAAGVDLTAAAAKAGLPLTTIAPVSAEGAGQDGKPVAGLSPAVVKAAFEGAQGQDSEILEEAPGEYFIVRVDRVVAPAMPPMAEIRPYLARNLMMRKVAEALRARAEALQARVQKGESIDAVAASTGAQVVRAQGISRATAQSQEALGRELLGTAFGSKKGDVFTAATSTGVAVATITDLRPGDVRQIAMAARQQQQQFTQQIFTDIGASVQTYAVGKVKAEGSIVNARAALGVAPSATPEKTDAAPKGK